MRPKLVAIDLDGTLLTTRQTVTPRAQEAVQRLTETGVRVVLCTGRPPRTARPYAAQLGLVDLGIVYNGGAIYDFRRNVARHRYDFPGEVARAVIHRMRARYPDIACGLEADYGWFVDTARYERVAYEEEPDGVGDTVEFVRERVTKLLFWHPTEDAETLSHALADAPVHCTWSMPGLLEVIAPGVNKRVALARVAESLGVGAAEVAAFGDENNDKEMLAWAGCGVAMGNASERVKRIADRVTSTNDEDGVAEVLETWL